MARYRVREQQSDELRNVCKEINSLKDRIKRDKRFSIKLGIREVKPNKIL